MNTIDIMTRNLLANHFGVADPSVVNAMADGLDSTAKNYFDNIVGAMLTGPFGDVSSSVTDEAGCDCKAIDGAKTLAMSFINAQFVPIGVPPQLVEGFTAGVETSKQVVGQILQHMLEEDDARDEAEDQVQAAPQDLQGDLFALLGAILGKGVASAR